MNYSSESAEEQMKMLPYVLIKMQELDAFNKYNDTSSPVARHEEIEFEHCTLSYVE